MCSDFYERNYLSLSLCPPTQTKTQREEDRRRPKRNSRDAGGDAVFADEPDERLRRFNERLRYSEDRGTERVRVRERRTYSDDYEEKARRESGLTRKADAFRVRPPTPKRVDRENKRNSAARLSRDSRVSYTEVEFPGARRPAGGGGDPRASDPGHHAGGVGLAKHSSVECRSTRQILEVPPRRAFSQSDDPHRPATPVPPIEWNDERYVPKKLPADHQKRDQKSTRYKVYLT